MSQVDHLRILIVDDHFMIRQLARNALSDTKIFDVQTACDGMEAIKVIAAAHNMKVPFDIVFLDWNMPKTNGLDVLSHFRAEPSYAMTAFAMLTAIAEEQNIMTTIRAGATSYIIKPVAAADLKRKVFEVNNWIGRTRKEGVSPLSS